MKRSLIILVAGLMTSCFLQAAVVTTSNLNFTGDGIFALFNQNGTLVPAANGEVRIGYFTISDSAILQAWDLGDLELLNGNFIQFGATFGLEDFDADINGAFEGGPSGNSDPFNGKPIVLWASNSKSGFTNLSAEYLIYRFDTTFQTDPWFGEVFLGTTPGVMLVGESGKYSHDVGFGAGPLPGFNTVAAVPEPSTAVLLTLSFCGVLFLLRRKRAVS